MALPFVATPLSARTCILSNVASEKACKPGCCANKKCCETSEKNRATPSQPLAKSGADQQNVTTVPATIVFALPVDVATESRVLSSAERIAHSPPLLLLTCIRLI
jgi:hypothetical protein